MHKELSGAACTAFAIAALLAPPATADGGGKDKASPPAHAPAHGVHGTQPGQVKKDDAPAPAPATAQPAAKPKSKRSKSERKAAKRAERAERKAAKRAAKTERRSATSVRPEKPKKERSAKHTPAATGDQGRGAKSNNGGGQPKTTICHATGSATNPYVQITIAAPAVRAHQRHQDGRDIVPAPSGGCPKPEVAAAVIAPVVAATRSAMGAPAPVAAPAPAPVATRASLQASTPVGVGSSVVADVPGEGRREVLGDAATVTPSGDETVLAQTGDADKREVLGETAEVTPATATSADDDGLPFTGMQAWLLALVGAGALLAGFALHRASRQSS